MKIEKVFSDKEKNLARLSCATLFDAAKIHLEKAPVIAVVGAGGKTSVIMEMSAELEAAKIRHLVMTTTHMWPFEETAYRMAAGETEASGKLTRPVDEEWQPMAGKIPVLIEGDGSKGLPLKVPAAHEPVIPEEASYVIGVIGAECLGRPIKEVCHRYALLETAEPDMPVTIELLAQIICSPFGLRKMTGARPFILVIHQADTPELRDRLMTLYPMIRNHVDQMILTCKDEFWQSSLSVDS